MSTFERAIWRTFFFSAYEERPPALKDMPNY